MTQLRQNPGHWGLKGLTVYLTYGECPDQFWKFKISRKAPTALRIVFWRFGFVVLRMDMDKLLEHLMAKADQADVARCN